jgi:transposase-like protein
MGRAITALTGPNRLSPKQEALALALASGATLQEAAGRHGVGLSTAKGWLADNPALRERVRELRRELTERAAGVLAEGMTEAAQALRRLLRSKSEAVQLKAAEALLAHGREQNSLADLQAEVDELRAATAGRQR